MFCSATLVALCPALSSTCMFSLFRVVSNHFFSYYSGFTEFSIIFCLYVFSFPCCFSSFVLFCYSRCTVSSIIFSLCFLFSFLFRIISLFCYSCWTVSSFIFCLYIFSFLCCFRSFFFLSYSCCSVSSIIFCFYVFSIPCYIRSFVFFCYSVALYPALSSACMFSLFHVVSDHLFCSVTLVALCPLLYSDCILSLFHVVSDHFFSSATLLHCVRHYLLLVCFLFSLLFRIIVLFYYSGFTVFSIIFCLYVFSFSCCF